MIKTSPRIDSGVTLVETYLVLGNRAFREGDYKTAVNYYLIAQQTTPDISWVIARNLDMVQRKSGITVEEWHLYNNPNSDSSSINYYGYIRAESGLGTACRGYIGALRYVEKNVTSINIPCGLRELDFPVQDKPNKSAMFNIVHMNADSISYFFSQVGEDCLKGKYNIGLWVWELAAFRPDWFESFQPFQEIWVPSEFCRQSISAVSPIPVHVIPHVVSKEINIHTNQRGYFNLPEDAFIFGYMFDCTSSVIRKNPFALIEAFKSVFKKDQKVILFLKISNGIHDPELYRKVQNAIDGYPNILTIEHSLDEIELARFYDAIDCYASPHRTEGFGLTLAEAMLAGKPVIATDYGGSVDFVKSEHAYPVQYRLIPIAEKHGPYLTDYLWAEPDVDHLIECLSEVYENPEIALSRGKAAQQFITKYYSMDYVAGLMRDRLMEILQSNARSSHE
jgi:glycosyltransferase involved in cell wall biosynthesis